MESQVSLESCSSLLTRSDDYWWVSRDVAKKDGFLRAKVGEEDQLVPPVQGWQFNDGTKWSSEETLECSREVEEIIRREEERIEQEEQRRKIALAKQEERRKQEN